MNNLRIVLVEPDDVEGLYPFSLTHAAWDIRLGYFTLIERWMRSLPQHRLHVQSTRALIQANSEYTPGSDEFAHGPVLLVTATLVVSPQIGRAHV